MRTGMTTWHLSAAARKCEPGAEHPVRPRARQKGEASLAATGYWTKMSTDGRSSAQVARIAWILWSAKWSNGFEAAEDPLPTRGKACCMSAQSNRGAHLRAPSRAV